MTRSVAIESPPVPILCPVCGLKLGEWVNGEVVQRHYGRVSAGAHTIACDRKGCTGVWSVTKR